MNRHRYSTALTCSLMTLLLVSGCASAQSTGRDESSTRDPGTPAYTADRSANTGRFRFEIHDDDGRLIPGRLTFLGEAGAGADLFPNANAKPDDLAVRNNVIFTLSGTGLVTVPVGRYTVYASHGLEWSIDEKNITITRDREVQWTATLRHEVDTTGWISGDFHLHTLTHSGHGDVNMNERIITLIGDGLEFAVATDHNHNTDYRPTIEGLQVEKHLTSSVGNEVSMDVGHFGVFPLDPNRSPIKRAKIMRKLFPRIRAETNKFGVIPVIQVNHPRWADINYFGHAGLDPITGQSEHWRWSDDFDTIEIMNGNQGTGYHDPQMGDDEFVPGMHSARRDWFNLLNQGYRYAAVGNSDSHNVYSTYGGYPRNFVRSSTDDPGSINAGEVATELRNKQVFTTLGPFVEFRVNGVDMGGDVRAANGKINIHIRVQAASWIDCDRVHVVVNGEIVRTIPVPQTREVVRLDTTETLRISGDSWIALLVEGDDSLAPIVHDNKHPCRPFAVANPIWVDADGDGKWISPWQQAQDRVRQARGGSLVRATRFDAASPALRGLIILAAAQQNRNGTDQLIHGGLKDESSNVRRFAARGAEMLAIPALLDPLFEALEAVDVDAYLAAAMLRAVHAIDQGRFNDALHTYLTHRKEKSGALIHNELNPLLPKQFIMDWMVLGHFLSGSNDAILAENYGPEKDGDTTRTYRDKRNRKINWSPARAQDTGFLALRGIGGRSGTADHAIAYAQTWLHSPDRREVFYTLGADDQCVVFLNDRPVYADTKPARAFPLRQVGSFTLNPGWNRLLIKVANVEARYGLVFRVLDDEVTSSVTGP